MHNYVVPLSMVNFSVWTNCPTPGILVTEKVFYKHYGSDLLELTIQVRYYCNIYSLYRRKSYSILAHYGYLRGMNKGILLTVKMHHFAWCEDLTLNPSIKVGHIMGFSQVELFEDTDMSRKFIFKWYQNWACFMLSRFKNLHFLQYFIYNYWVVSSSVLVWVFLERPWH